MRIIYLFVITMFLAGCAGRETVKEPVSEKTENKQVQVVEKEIVPSVGWTDKDTYTVSISAPDMDKAKDAAKHKILQDIVKVRVLNESRYTDITKISAEFDKPLKEGKVISQKQVDNGVIIYYQIRDTGLKEKFEKK